MPLAMVGSTPALLESLLDSLDVGVNTPLDDSLRPEMNKVYLPEDLPSNPEQPPDPECAIAEGFETTIQRSILLNGQPIKWTERVLCVKSFVYAQVQRKGLNNRLEQAEAALRALTPPPGRGRKQYTDEAALNVPQLSPPVNGCLLPYAEGKHRARTAKEITLTTIRLPNGATVRNLTPLTNVQELILSLLGMPAAIYTDLVARPMMVCEGKADHRYAKMRLNPSTIAHRASSYVVRVY